MTLDLVVTRRAARELERIVVWWAANRPAARGAVRQDLELALGLLREQPGIGSPVGQAGEAGVRRIHLSRIRYWVYYRVRGNRLEVLSVWHASRERGPAV